MACCSGCSRPRPGSAAAPAEETPPKEVRRPDERNEGNTSSALESDGESSPEDISVADGHPAHVRLESLATTASQPELEPNPSRSAQTRPATLGDGCCG